ncbi:MAG: sigma-70 family RNA polymerase sigma factor [Aliifodinibius sp.]|nr:sigma-70 family RNA polymerase sigma factor [Fodinibius sp.]NIW96955.1 sigma-70 family RNA polymerase sigma factor [Phycisphaerae bacterium]NIY27119.1 sigma-70 family RNA polymerase sigma factor [Fodinibius sp.]
MTAFENEDELIEAAKTDPEVFGLLYERYVNKIYNYIYYRTSNHEDAEDLTAKVFHKALSHIGNYKNKGRPFSAWLYRIAHNLVANWHRDQKKRTTVSLDDVNLTGKKKDHPFHSTAKSEEMILLLEAIQKLPPVRQQLLILKFVEGESNAEIGRILKRSEGAVKSLYHRTLLSLKELLIEHPEIFEPLETIHDH